VTAPIFETYEATQARDGEAGDFLVVSSAIVGVSYTAAKCFALVGCTVLCGSHPGAADGEIVRVYRRLAEPAAAEAGAK
jgi:hypothetical protein